ncbi:uncharacterized protein SPSC_05167 [Sporisorium scitamineum]|uniref:Uncharacterized protein n=1 Tax=Sporisorium scitamineum TaxID=49012 RepID=A0A0F7S3B3_9BASI|nr:hypothetical protein [Sporisorium scitamineum]CDU25333.1 uncharacterized protein SPSC_05167 [Sporisorium scitamineum]
MPSSSSPSRLGSSSSPWPEDASHSADTPSSTSDIPTTNTPDKRPTPHRKRLISSRSGLAKPFRSPLKQSRSQLSMDNNATSTSSAAGEGTTAEASSSSPVSIRKQRQTLEARLLLLQQANQCLRDDALTTLPRDIARWREAGQLAAQDLWKMTGADAGDWSGLSGIPSRGEYGLESPPSSLAEASRKRQVTESPEPSHPPLLSRKFRVHSPGAEEQAAALLSIDDPIRHQTGEDSQGAHSEGSLPEASELLRRSQSVAGASSTPSQRKSLLGSQGAVASTSSSLASGSGKGIGRKWNIGSMLDMLGADKSTLAWDAEQEDFQDPTTSSARSKAS